MKDCVYYIMIVDEIGKSTTDPMVCFSSEEAAEEAAKEQGLQNYWIFEWDVS